jgi:hypothetical protein
MRTKWMGVAALTAMLFSGAAFASGLYTNGLTGATLPLTGNETIPADTNLTQGLNPETEAITTSQFLFGAAVQYTANTAAVATTATAASVAGSNFVVLDMTGNITGDVALTTPTAAQIRAALPGSGFTGQEYILRVINEDATNAWTLTGGTGVTVSGTAAVAAGTDRDFMVKVTSATAVTMQSIGAGTK